MQQSTLAKWNRWMPPAVPQLPHERMETPISILVRRRREALGISQSELARRIECDPSFISRIEGGQMMPGMKSIIALAPALGVADIVVFGAVRDTLHELETTELAANRRRIDSGLCPDCNGSGVAEYGYCMRCEATGEAAAETWR